MLQFTRLHLTGFKSFVDPTELLIAPGLTGVVGPNGCGKSNLLEALRWVMGETSAKQMRGAEMEDVIFAGSADRPRRSIAEVVLEMHSKGISAPPPFEGETELHVSRRIERAKGSVYRVNGREVRARDVHLLFADAASGARSAAMVTQGQVAQLIAAKPQDRRSLLDEAAGIGGLASRRQEAEQRLRAAEANLQRLDDVLGTLEVQLRHLRKQGQQAARYRELSGQIRALEAALALALWQRVLAAETCAREGFEQATATAEAARAEAAAAAARRSVLAAEIPGLREADAASATAWQSILAERDTLDAADRQAARDRDAARAALREIEADLKRSEALAADAAASIAHAAAEQERMAHHSAGDPDRLASARAALAETQAKVAESDAQVLAATAEVAHARAHREAVERSHRDVAQQLSRLTQRRDAVQRERNEVATQLTELADPQQAEAELERWTEACDQARALLAREEAARGETVQAEEAASRALRECEALAARLRAEHAGLKAACSAAPGTTARPLLDRTRVQPGYETALSVAFGDDLLAPEADAGGAGATAVWHALPPAPSSPLPAGLAALAAFVEAPAVLGRALQQIGIAADGASAAAVHHQLAPGQSVVSPDGALWRWDGLHRRAGAPAPAAVRLQQHRRLDELALLLEEAESRRDAAAERAGALRGQVQALKAAEQTARAGLRTAETALTQARDRLTAARGARVRLEARLLSLADGCEAVIADHEDAALRLHRVEEERAALPTDGHAQRALEQQRAALAALRARHGEQRSRCEALEREAAGRVRRLQALAADLASWTQRQGALQSQVQSQSERRTALVARCAELDEAPALLAEQRQALLDRLSATEAGRKAAADRLAVGEAELGASDLVQRTAERALGDAREALVRAEAALQQAEQERRQAEETIALRFERRPDALAPLAEAAPDVRGDPAAGERRLERLRRERDQMGAVNLRAEEEATAMQAQVSDLTLQKDDLLTAIGKLRRATAELDREGAERLRAAFEEIDGHFRALFTRLFGGGRAFLTLTEPDDPLNSGLDIMASPPGKKLQVMSLLSGGEQALTAVALRFALFLIRPSPVCVLDEVDAPLDDANVDRFCNLLDDLAQGGTRFLVITHHRLTMARMDRLFGVTMADRGASRLVSVDLGRAEALRQTA